MSEIFVSYAEKDRPRAAKFVAALEQQGWSVFWDIELRAGSDFSEFIESVLEKAKCVVVLWSETSITSGWVRDEAGDGKRRGILIPVRIDAVRPPMGFRSIHTADLSKWRGGKAGPAFRKLINDIGAKLAESPDDRTPLPRRKSVSKRKRSADSAAARKKPGTQPRSRKRQLPKKADSRTQRGAVPEGRSHSRAATLFDDRSDAFQWVAFGVLILLLLASSFYIGMLQVAQWNQPPSWQELKAIEEAEARAREEKLWQRAKSENKVVTFEEYLKVYPNSRHRNEARQRISNLQQETQQAQAAKEAQREVEIKDLARDEKAWNDATLANNIESYKSYLRNFKKGRYRAAALRFIETLEAEAAKQEKDNAAWKRAQRDNTVESYEGYLSSQKEGQYREQAYQNIDDLRSEQVKIKDQELRKHDEAAWVRAQRENTVESYTAYITQNRIGLHRAEAQKRIVALREQALRKASEREARLKAEAEARKREDAAWAVAKKQNTIEGYTIYLTLHPQGRYHAEAAQEIASLREDERQKRKAEEDRLRAEKERRRQDDEAWAGAKRRNTVEAYREYLDGHRNGQYREAANQLIAVLEDVERRRADEEVKRKADEEAWIQARKFNKADGYEKYVKSFPNGKHKERAQERIAELKAADDFTLAKRTATLDAEQKKLEREKEVWDRAEMQNTIGGYTAYLQAYPKGQYESEARTRREKLRAKVKNRRILAVYENIDFFGNDINEKKPGHGARDLKACWTACEKEYKKCNAFTYNEKTRQCYLKGVTKDKVVVFAQKNATAGLIFERHDTKPGPIIYPIVTYKDGYKYSGANLSETPFEITQSKNREQRCRAACFAESQCVAYTYDKRSGKGECWLKETEGERRRDPTGRFSSGKKMPELQSVPALQTFKLRFVPAATN